MDDTLHAAPCVDINYMRQLQPNWDSYGAVPPSENTIQRAERRLSEFKGYKPSRICPSCAGGKQFGAIGFTWKHAESGLRAYLELYDDNSDYLLMSDGWSEPYTEEVTCSSSTQIVKMVQSFFHGE